MATVGSSPPVENGRLGAKQGRPDAKSAVILGDEIEECVGITIGFLSHAVRLPFQLELIRSFAIED